MRLTIHRQQGKLNLRQLLIGVLVVWPFLYSMWLQIRFTAAAFAQFPLILLGAAALIALICFGKLYQSILLVWLIFYGVTLILSFRSNKRVFFMDFAVSFSSWLICYTACRRNVSFDMVCKIVRRLGIITAVSVVLDSTTHIISRVIAPLLYTSSAVGRLAGKTGILSNGLFTYAGITGCFLVPGLFAFLVSYRNKKKNAYFWIMLSVMALSIILINKRGFILDIAISLLVVFLVARQSEGKIKLRLNRVLLVTISILIIISVLFAMYMSIPLVRQSVTNIMDKFADDDGTLSGRTELYDLALRLFRQHPILGIGWGNFREQSLHVYRATSTSTYETHNVYLQLLCETGIVGLSAFLITTIWMLMYTIRRFLRVNAMYPDSEESLALRLSMYMQLFFITYCFSGNPLYDYVFVVTYFIGIALLGVNEREYV